MQFKLHAENNNQCCFESASASEDALRLGPAMALKPASVTQLGLQLQPRL
jgi:hypothetical protein